MKPVNRPRLTAAMIVRDEEAFLPGCLASLAGVVDEVVVVDTGSKDASPEIAHQAGATVLHHPWNDDFAAARNAALDAAHGDWILYIDADERVEGGLPATLSSQLDAPELVGLSVRFQPAAGFTPYLEERLFRRHRDIRFEGTVHESHLSSLVRHARRHGLHRGDSDLCLRHLGYDGDMSWKHRRNLPLLEARLQKDPDHVYSWWHLGQTLRGLGKEAEAVTAWRKGLDASRRRKHNDGTSALPYLSVLQLDGPKDVALLAEALKRFPDHPQLRWLRAEGYIKQGRPAEALRDLEALVDVDTDSPVARDFAVETRLFQRLAPRALALAYFRLSRFQEAACLFRQLQRAPDLTPQERTEFEVKARLAELRAARPLRGDAELFGAYDGPRGG